MNSIGARRLYPLLGVVVLLLGAQLIGVTGLAGRSWPPLTDVVAYLAAPAAFATVMRGFGSTALAAGNGLLLGVALAALGALLSILVPVVRPGLDRLAALLQAVPLIALAPLLITTVGRDGTPAVVAALGVGFVMFVSMTSGLHAASAAHNDLFTVLGARRRRRLTRLQLPAALPAVLDGLALAAPTAVLGATIGEWFGAPRGLGVLLVSAMQNYQIPLLWSAALCCTLLSLVSYLVVVRLQLGAVRRFT